MSTIKFTIDGKEIIAENGITILEAATKNGIEIPTLCYHESVALYGACGICTVEAEGIPKLLRACSAKVSDGMVIHTNSERVKKSRKIALELLMSDHTGDCVGPCSLNCPAGTDCQGYVKLISEGKFHEAVALIKEKLPLPASIGRVCPHPCETACRRQMVEESISIAYLKAFAADEDMKENAFVPEVAEDTGKKVAIIGGGPAGLTAAYFLRTKGHSVTVFDAMPEMGGMLRYGIPEYRLPKKVVAAEVNQIASLGVEMKNKVKIGKDITLEDLRNNYDAVLVAIGAWNSMGTRCVGESLDGIVGGIDFLREVNMGAKPDIGKKVAVVGGGNTAMDACRTARRLGAEEVYVIYRRTRDEMPAEKIEIDEAEEEGVKFKFLTNPAEYVGENGKVKQIKLQIMELGEPDSSGRRSPVPVEGKFEYLDVDTVITAIGQKVNVKGFEELELNSRGIISADEKTFRTSVEGVFAVGDATNKGASIAIEAIGEAEKASKVIDGYLLGMEIPYRKPFVSEKIVTPEMLADKEKIARAKMPVRKAEERVKTFDEISLGFTKEQAMKEASRCLRCGCHDYHDCKLIKYANWYDIKPERFAGMKNIFPKERKLVSIERDQSKCILCGLCVRVCDEVAKKGILGLIGRGFTTTIKPEFKNDDVISFCKDCHKCVDACPTGALKIIEE
ncbi:MAG: FAD-dependent oxidoreductase [Ruminococcaceae bacterium]|nr:FAD-dependent oxidoreductase [Oscillospiraceae bacterium]